MTKKTKRKRSKSKTPKIVMEDVEDYYTYYVIILGMTEDLFWNVDLSFLLGVLANKLAYDDYINYIKEMELEAMQKRK